MKNPSVGGPDKEELLFSLEDIENDFQEFETIKLEETEISLREGVLHNGMAKVVRFIGKKVIASSNMEI